MNWYSTMGLVSTFAMFGPIVLILSLRLTRYRSFPFLLFYYGTVFVYNLITERYIYVSPDVEHYWGLINNLTDAPVMILFLTYFSTSRTFTQRMQLLAFIFVLFEAVVIAVLGFNIEAATVIMGPGLLLVCGLGIYFFIRNTRQAIENRKATGKAFIITSLLFAYGCYFIIYLLYYVFKAQNLPDGSIDEKLVNDTFLIYFIAATVSAGLMCAGLLVEQKRIRKLKELKITRKELTTVYSDTKKAVRIRTAMLDFDRELWN